MHNEGIAKIKYGICRDVHPADFGGGGYLNLAKTFDTLLAAAASRGLSPSSVSPHAHPFFSPLFPHPPPPSAFSLHSPLLPLMQAAPPHAGLPILGFPSPPLAQHSPFASTYPVTNASLVIRKDEDEEEEGTETLDNV